MNARLRQWLSVFGPAVLALLFAGPAAIEHGWVHPIRLGGVTIGILPGGWLIFAVIGLTGGEAGIRTRPTDSRNSVIVCGF